MFYTIDTNFLSTNKIFVHRKSLKFYYLLIFNYFDTIPNNTQEKNLLNFPISAILNNKYIRNHFLPFSLKISHISQFFYNRDYVVYTFFQKTTSNIVFPFYFIYFSHKQFTLNPLGELLEYKYFICLSF